MHPSQFKILLGLSVQVDRLASEQGLLKLFNDIPFHIIPMNMNWLSVLIQPGF